MKITLQMYGTTYTAETKNDDISSDELLGEFRGLMIAAGFHVKRYEEE